MRAVAEEEKQKKSPAKKKYESIIGANAPNGKLYEVGSVLSGGQA
jgi:hypothetical protein